jgi:hypothetical protein
MMRMIVRPTYSIINYGLHVVGAGEKKIKYNKKNGQEQNSSRSEIYISISNFQFVLLRR